MKQNEKEAVFKAMEKLSSIEPTPGGMNIQIIPYILTERGTALLLMHPDDIPEHLKAKE